MLTTRRDLRTKVLRTGCCFLVALSAMCHSFNAETADASNNPSPQERAAQERAAQELAERTAQLKKAELTSKENPEGYIYALTTMSSVLQGFNAVNKKPQEDSQADKYFVLALNCFVENKFDKDASRRIATHLWQTSGALSPKGFNSIFDKICMATNRGIGDDLSADNDMVQALRSRTSSREDRRRKTSQADKISPQEQLNFILKAIAIRTTALGARSKTLHNLLWSAGQFYEENNEKKLAEQYYLKTENLDSNVYSKAGDAGSMADFYLRQNDPIKAINAWRRGAAITSKSHIGIYIDGEFNKVKDFEKAGHLDYANEIMNFMFANINADALDKFDTFLKEIVNQYVKNIDFQKAQDLTKKRIATGIRLESTSGLTDWKIRLSNIYLAQGNDKDSEALFKQVVANLALQGLPTDAIRRDRAELLKSMGK